MNADDYDYDYLNALHVYVAVQTADPPVGMPVEPGNDVRGAPPMRSHCFTHVVHIKHKGTGGWQELSRGSALDMIEKMRIILTDLEDVEMKISHLEKGKG
jgi:hypothetical protein